jgi:ABC-type uncharacterized transport system permease subunit
MERWWLAMATVFAAAGGAAGLRSVLRGRRSAAAVWCMVGALACQFVFLWLRGAARGACPLGDAGEVLAYLGWSLTLCYLLTGHAYRWSPVGVFTAPIVMAVQLAALWPGMLGDAHGVGARPVNAWGEGHAAMSVLSYGIFGMAAVTATMFLVLDRKLKGRDVESWWFRAMPPVGQLRVSMMRLVRTGWLLMTVGIGCGWMARAAGGQGATGHLVAALLVWLAYLALLVFEQVRGAGGRRMAMLVAAMFLVSLTVFLLL